MNENSARQNQSPPERHSRPGPFWSRTAVASCRPRQHYLLGARGQSGRVGQGLNAGGLTYGYAAVPGDPGRREIVETEAEIVRQIFRDYVSGGTPRCRTPAESRASSAAEGAWNASTINGNAQRGTGILQNELYAGKFVWNKVRMVKDPDTGQRVSRPNPRSEWQVTEVPHLAIISKELFEAAQARRQARRTTPPKPTATTPAYVVGPSPLWCVWSGMSTNGKDKSGRIRIRCSAATESGTCTDPKTFYLDTVESAVLNGLSSELRHPDVIAEYVRTYHEERKRLAADADAKRIRLDRRLGELTREIDRLVDAIAKGLGDPAVLGPRSTALHEERKGIEAELEKVPPPTEVVALHPAMLARYEQQLTRL